MKSIGAKVFAIIAFLGVLFFVTIAVNLASFSTINSNNNKVNTYFEMNEAENAAIVAFQQAQLYSNLSYFKKDTDEIELMQTKLNTAISEMNTMMAELGTLCEAVDDAEILALYQTMNETMSSFASFCTEVYTASTSGNFALTKELVDGQKAQKDPVQDAIDAYDEYVGTERAQILNTSAAQITMSRILAVVFTVLYVVCLFISIAVAKRIFIAPIKKLQAAAKGLAEGDIEQKIEIKSNDEFGTLAQDFTNMIENIGGQAHIAERVAEGDLTVVCTPASEKDVMGKAIEKMLNDNNRNLTVIRDAAARMASGANEVASASSSLAQGTTQQASAIEEITASIEEIANGARVNADDANKANELAQSTKNDAVRGNDQMKQMIDAMQDISEASENISKIMKTIDDIAFQTNILALNASVEAARAGVHGKGFAVVADEVRNLANKSAEAAKDSAGMIEDSIRKVEIGSKLALGTAEALEEILASVEDIANIVSHIASASANQASSVSQVNAGITQIADVVQTNSATSQECAAASSELSSLAGQLQHAVSRYRLLIGSGQTDDEDDGIDFEEDGLAVLS
ncbi:MAG: methyl-accepting chemotaxis protein [Lachnospiraceae bacterium]|nr:methyl-accepting chemotaxis protein [Lachnospiraceae bacterium]